MPTNLQLKTQFDSNVRNQTSAGAVTTGIVSDDFNSLIDYTDQEVGKIQTQASHGFTVGQALVKTSAGWVAGQATTTGNKAYTTVSVSQVIDANNFRVARGGETFSTTGLSLPADTLYFLSNVTSGINYTSTVPSSVGQVYKPLFLTTSSSEAIVLNSAPFVLTTISDQVFNVLDYGLVGDGAFNNKIPLQTLLDTIGPLSGGRVYFPKGNYVFYNTVTPTWYFDTANTVTATNQVARIFVKYANTQLEGESRHNTTFTFKGTGGNSPAGTTPGVNFTLISDVSINSNPNNVAVRNPGIMIWSRTTGQDVVGTRIRNITLDGGAPYTGTYGSGYADPTNGLGWDISHKAIFFYDDGSSGANDTLIEDCELKNWRGEGIWSGNANVKTVRVHRCDIHDCNGSAISMGGSQQIVDNEIYNSFNGIESYPGPGTRSVITLNRIHDCTVSNNSANGIVWGGFIGTTVEDMQAIISENQIWNNDSAGILVLRSTRCTSIRDNRIWDCNSGIRLEALGSSQFSDLVVKGNVVQSVARTVSTGIYLAGNTAPLDNIFIQENVVRNTVLGTQNSVGVINAFVFYNTNGTVYVQRNTFDGYAHGAADGNIGGSIKLPVMRDNFYPGGPYLNTFALAAGATVTVVPPLEELFLVNTGDPVGTNDVTVNTATLQVGHRLKFFSGNSNTKFRFNTGGVWRLTAPVILNALQDWAQFEFRNGKLELIASSIS